MPRESSKDKVLVETIGRIRIVLINRPECRNAVDGETAHALFDAFKQFDKDDDVDIAILAGTDGTFCSGADLKAFSSGGDINPIMEGELNSLAPMGPSRLRLSKPVIAAIEGHAVAGGMELALWCDLRVMANNATFGIFCRRFGVPLIDMGTIRLPQLIGQSRAMDLVLTGRPVEAKEAFEIGLANRLAEPGSALEEAMKLAGEILAHPQTCMKNDRASLLDQANLSENDAIINETRLGLASMHSGETIKGAKRFTDGQGRHGEFKTEKQND